jgi:ribosomal protein S1
MADLMAKQTNKVKSISRGEEVEGIVVAFVGGEIIVDLGTKAEGVFQKKDLSPDQAKSIKIGDKITASVIHPENQSGQVVLGLQRAAGSKPGSEKFTKFQRAISTKQIFKGKAIESNKGGLVVEVDGVRGFVPTSQVSLSQAANIEELIGKELDLITLEVEPNQNRLIFTQKTTLTEESKSKLSALKAKDKVKGKVAAVLPFGVFVSLENGVEGLAHISELSWEKVEDPNTLYKVGDEVEAVILSIDEQSGRANLSIKQLAADPFADKIKDIQVEDVLKGVVVKITQNGVNVLLKESIDAIVPSAKLAGDEGYTEGEEYSFLVDSVDKHKRRINLAPFITSTKDLIYR